MERAEKRTVVAVARAADSLGMIRAGDWVEIATQMVGHGADDGPIVDLAILSKPTSRWSTELPVAAVCELLDIAEPAPEEATFARRSRAGRRPAGSSRAGSCGADGPDDRPSRRSL